MEENKIFYDINEINEREIQENIDETSDINIDSFESAYVLPMDLNIEMITNWVSSKKIEMSPNFQRRFVWNDTRISQFIESLILNIPIPSILLANNEATNKFIVIDGKQRINAILKFIAPEKDGKGLKLKGLKVLKELEGYTYAKLKEDKTKDKFAIKVENFVMKTNVLKNYDINLLYFIFSRLNSGSMGLSTQELRQSLFPGEFINFINDYSLSSSGIKRVLKLKQPDSRMKDCELLIRYYSFKYFYKQYDGNINQFFNKTCEILNSDWAIKNKQIIEDAQELEKSIDFIYNYFGNDAFKVYFTNKDEEFFGPFNRPMFDLMTTIFSQKKYRDNVINKKINLKEFTIKMFKYNKLFAESFLPTTHTKEKTFARLDEFAKELNKLINDTRI